MKKTIIAPLSVIGCAAVVATLALGGAGKFGDVRVNAEPKEYSVTFNWKEPTTVEEVDSNYVISTTTAAGNKVGVVGRNTGGEGSERFYFVRRIFTDLRLYDFQSALTNVAFEFRTITGFAISFSGGSVAFNAGETAYDPVTNGEPYKGLSITPSDYPRFTTTEEDIIQVNYLTIWYSC